MESTKDIIIRFTKEEHQELHEKSKHQNKSISDFIRLRLFRFKPESEKFLRQLKGGSDVKNL